MIDLFQLGQDRARWERLLKSPEFALAESIARSAMLERPHEAPWIWAEREVFLDEKMTAEPDYYKSVKTPWAREWQEMPLRPEVRELAIMKPSRCGASEAAFNIVRWMPQHWPGNVGIVFPDDKQARDVVKRRLLDSILQHAEAQLTGDKDDTNLSNIHLLNMVIKVGPSGSARLFTEWWVRFFILDELEEHDATDSTTTYERALSRQTDVADALLYAISKPKKAGGPIHRAFLRGTQKLWETPCPRCERGFVFNRNVFENEPDCRKADGTWDLDLVVKGTYAVCPHCKGRIDEWEKRSMNDAALWVPTAAAERRRNEDGDYVPPVPGVESYQITDYVSYHPAVTWGILRSMYLQAFEIQPTQKAKAHYMNNHEGEPEERKVIASDKRIVDGLRAGRVEPTKVTLPDGTVVERNEVIGKAFKLAYKGGRFNAALPFWPDHLLLFTDKQQSCLKYLVFAVRIDESLVGQCEAYLVEVGRVDDETELKERVVKARYPVEGMKEMAGITAGFIDARYRPQAVYQFCLECYSELGVNIWPVRGEGEKDKRRSGDATERFTENNVRGKLMRYLEDSCERGKLTVRYFKDHPLKTIFYGDKIAERSGWRIWLPEDYPTELAAEWTAEVYDADSDTWIHQAQKRGPNDWGDCGKMLVLWLIEHLPIILQNRGLQIVPEAEEKAEVKEGQKEREYQLRKPD